eukprot:SAG25_NODE_273_length_10590_cov_137.207968_8_plen_82_part_00
MRYRSHPAPQPASSPSRFRTLISPERPRLGDDAQVKLRYGRLDGVLVTHGESNAGAARDPAWDPASYSSEKGRGLRGCDEN